jgi:DNA-binding MarR family transcriptional regulator
MTGESRKLAIASAFGPIANARTSAPVPAQGSTTGEPGEAARLAAAAQVEYAARRRRDRLFNAHIFAEPAWDMLLDLYIQRHRARPVSVQSLCIAAAVPQTTALRWIGKLDARGLVDRRPCAHDMRVIHVTLSEIGLELMERYLQGQLGKRAVTPMSFS